MLWLSGDATDNMLRDSSQERIEHGCWGWNRFRLGKQIAIIGLAVLRVA